MSGCLGPWRYQKMSFNEFLLDCSFDMGEPATIAEINECEQALDFSFPPSHREFLLKHNGASLFCTDAGYTADIEVFGTKALLKYWLEHKEFCDQSIF